MWHILQRYKWMTTRTRRCIAAKVLHGDDTAMNSFNTIVTAEWHKKFFKNYNHRYISVMPLVMHQHHPLNLPNTVKMRNCFGFVRPFGAKEKQVI